jgi:hypothetical protein
LHRDNHVQIARHREYNTFPPGIPHREKTTYASIKVLLEPSPSRVARRGGRLDLIRTILNCTYKQGVVGEAATRSCDDPMRNIRQIMALFDKFATEDATHEPKSRSPCVLNPSVFPDNPREGRIPPTPIIRATRCPGPRL